LSLAHSAWVVVTGAAGFLGSHLVDALLDKGYNVIGLDNLSSGHLDNLKQAKQHPSFRFFEHDVCQPFEHLLTLPIEAVFNLACPASPPVYQATPIQTLKTSVLGTLHALELAQQHGAICLQASTSEVYGSPQVHPQPESYWGNVNPTGLRACYDEGKRAAESLCLDMHRQHGTRIKVVRIFNTYGPRMSLNDGRVMSTLVRQALAGEALSVFGNGQQTRCFCYVSDFIEGLLNVAFKTPDSFTGPVNLGSDTELTILQVAEQVQALSARPLTINYQPLPSDDPPQRKPDLSLARQVLGWQPNTPLEAGLQYYWHWAQAAVANL
jgi:UDP-glucuronate decarboxylase